ncbi:MAG TPA: protein kinase [Polyangiaceae bacterium]|nr:protein kinase [Polyangiaceae bacterium]
MSSFGAQFVPSERQLPTRIGAYRIVGLVATGSTSDILAARQEGPCAFDRAVVLKVLLPELRRDLRAVRALAREAAAYARVSHPAILRLHDFIEQDGDSALVLEHVEGFPLNTLRAALHRQGQTLDDDASMFIASRLFAALTASHRARDPFTGELTPVIHADVNPTNVLVPWDGYVKLADFGSARISGGHAEASTAPPAGPYLAPEQARGEEPSARADVYSASLVLWELLTGRRAVAHGRRSRRELLEAVAHPRLPAIESLRADLPAQLRDLLVLGLQPDPDRRHLEAKDALSVLRASADLSAARDALAENMAALRLAFLDSDRLESTPKLPHIHPATDPSFSKSGGDHPNQVPPTSLLGDVEPASAVQTLSRSDRPMTLSGASPAKWTWKTTTPGRLAAAGSFGVAGVVAVIWLVLPRTAPQSRGTVGASAPRAVPPAIGTSSSFAEAPPPSRDPSPTASPTVNSPPASATADSPPERGVLRVPPARAGHRVWIDGRLVGEAPGLFYVPCGPHTVRVGSRGAPQRVVVRCREEVVVL